MSFLIFRGQGIKLTSYVAKKCREKGVLMPVINKGSKDDGYEGAIVLEPKCGLYLDTPIAVGDFASLYPSSMLSENLCPSSKVWTKIYDLAGNLITETGTKKENEYNYDNLEWVPILKLDEKSNWIIDDVSDEDFVVYTDGELQPLNSGVPDKRKSHKKIKMNCSLYKNIGVI